MQKALFFSEWGANYPLKMSSFNHAELKNLSCFLMAPFLLITFIFTNYLLNINLPNNTN